MEILGWYQPQYHNQKRRRSFHPLYWLKSIQNNGDNDLVLLLFEFQDLYATLRQDKRVDDGFWHGNPNLCIRLFHC